MGSGDIDIHVNLANLTEANVPNLPASKITSGALAVERVPNLPSSQITSGTIDAARIPELHLISGSLHNAQIPGLLASKITGGVFSLALIPTLPATKVPNLENLNGAITNSQIPDLNTLSGSITHSQLQDDSVREFNILNSAVTSNKIRDDAVISTKLLDAAVTTDKIHDLAVDTDKLGPFAVTTAKIANDAVTNDIIGPLAVTTGKIDNLAVTNAKLGALAVDTAKLGPGAVIESKIQDLNVTTDKIANLAIKSAKIEDRAVISSKIALASLVDEHMSLSVKQNLFPGYAYAYVGTYPNYYDGLRIPILPNMWCVDDADPAKNICVVDTGSYAGAVRVNTTSSRMLAFVSIPPGWEARSLQVMTSNLAGSSSGNPVNLSMSAHHVPMGNGTRTSVLSATAVTNVRQYINTGVVGVGVETTAESFLMIRVVPTSIYQGIMGGWVVLNQIG